MLNLVQEVYFSADAVDSVVRFKTFYESKTTARIVHLSSNDI